jgi:hypothetical protein
MLDSERPTERCVISGQSAFNFYYLRETVKKNKNQEC